MWNKRFFLIGASFFVGLGLNAQNLVQNPGFEELDGKLKKLGQVELAKGWFSTTAAPSDLFNKDTKKEEIGIPENYQGSQKATEGDGYAGFVAYSFRGKEPRTYLTNELTQSLKKGQMYCVTYKVSLSKLSKYGVNNISAFLSKKDPSTKDTKTLMYPAQIKHKKNPIYDDQYEFKDVCNVFTSNGGEKYITIGNFEKDEDTEFVKMRRVKGITATQTHNAYYYIDEVSVVPIDDKSECSCGDVEARPAKLVFSVSATYDENAPLSQKLPNETVYFDFLSDEIEPNFESRLQLIAKELKANTSIKILLTGHSDEEEIKKALVQERYEGLGGRRAESIKDFLVENGVDASRISTKDVENSDPAAKGASDIARAKCRRVTFSIN
ncbi:MAG: OmpA family protein [Luteibaculaceae bacterium]